MIRIAICDDDKNDVNIIRDYVTLYFEEKPLFYEISVFESGEELLTSKHIFDVILLDVEMTGINGIQAGKSCRNKNRNIKIIYITSFPKYWIGAMNSVHAFAYLQKPVSFHDILVQMDELLKSLEEKVYVEQEVSFEVLNISKEYELNTEFKKFNVDNIYYFEYINRKIKIKTSDGEYYFVNQMKDIIEKMQVYKFETCHQCFLINLKYVNRIKGYDLYLENGEIIPISQKKSACFRAKMHKYIQINI